MNIGRAIKHLRKEKKINQTKFARACGISQTSLSLIETDDRVPKRATLKKICKIFRVPEIYIYILSTEEKDIPKNKKQVYKILFPLIKTLISEST